MRDRVAASLTSHGLQATRRLDAPAGHVEDGEIDESSIIVLVCNVDAPREMAILRRLRHELREPAIVVISPPATGTGVRRALEAGADAFVFESELESTLAATVRAVASGQSVVPRKLRASLERPALSHRERQVLALVVKGLTNAQIARELILSESTIKSHLSAVFSKLGVRSRWEAAAVVPDLAAPDAHGQNGRRACALWLRRSRDRVNSTSVPGTLLPAAANVGAQVPFIRLDETEPELLAELLEVVERVARKGAFTLGDEVENFEDAFARWGEAEHAVGVSSGTAAIELALRALGIGPGDEVIVPSNSFIATAEAVTAAGAKPRFVDVDARTALLTAEVIEQALTSRTRCVIPVHLYGRTVKMDPLLTLCRARGIAVVEDACQAHGARYRGRPVGSLGDAGCFSFYPTKNLGAWGDGGAVVTNDAGLADRVRLLRSHGEASRHNHEMPAGTHRLHALQAAILLVKLAHLDRWNERRRTAGRSLADALAGSSVAQPPPPATDGDHVFHLFVVRTPARDALRRHLDSQGIASAIHYPKPIHLQPAYVQQGPGLGRLPVAEQLAAESCSLPIFPSIEEREIAQIAAAVESFADVDG